MDRGILFRETAGHEIIETIADHTDMGDPKRLVEGMLGQMLQMHRTHQQDVIRTVTQFIRGVRSGVHGEGPA